MDNMHQPLYLGIQGQLELEFSSSVSNWRKALRYRNDTIINMKAAVASALAGITGAMPNYIALGTGASTEYASSNSDTNAVLGLAGQTQLAQEWVVAATVNGYVRGYLLWLKRIGTSAGTLTVEYQENTTGLPNGSYLGGDSSGILSQSVAINSLGTTYGWVYFPITTPSKGHGTGIHHLVLKSTGYTYSAGITEVHWGVDTSAPSYAGGDFEKYDGTTWSAYSPAADGCFRIIVDPNNMDTAIWGELTRVPISSRSKSSTNVVRHLGIIQPAVANDYIGTFGLFDQVTAGTLLAVAATNFQKLSTQAISAYWQQSIL